jgi:hypothetical protein
MFFDRLTNHVNLDLDQFHRTSISVASIDRNARAAHGDRKSE